MKSQSGRSMVEMLGVLAIIGVLSVGAIAGYQKAMMKYKLNKHAESFNILIHNSIQLFQQIGFNDEVGATYYGNILKKLNMLPDGIKYRTNTSLEDLFKNEVWVYQYGRSQVFGIGMDFEVTSYGHEICANIVRVAKEYSRDIKSVNTQKYLEDGSIETGVGRMYGDNYCTEERKCLQNMTLDDIQDICYTCEEGACYLYIRLS